MAATGSVITAAAPNPSPNVSLHTEPPTAHRGSGALQNAAVRWQVFDEERAWECGALHGGVADLDKIHQAGEVRLCGDSVLLSHLEPCLMLNGAHSIL